MDWIVENWALIVLLLGIAIGAMVAALRILKPDSFWLGILVYILGIIEDLAPELAKKVKGEVAAKMHLLPVKQQIALQDACAVVDPKKPNPESLKKAV